MPDNILALLQRSVNMNSMNERLREFERASGLEIYGLGARRIPWEAALEKYAELIIKETLEVARAGVEYGDGMEDAVYKYFGFKE